MRQDLRGRTVPHSLEVYNKGGETPQLKVECRIPFAVAPSEKYHRYASIELAMGLVILEPGARGPGDRLSSALGEHILFFLACVERHHRYAFRRAPDQPWAANPWTRPMDTDAAIRRPAYGRLDAHGNFLGDPWSIFDIAALERAEAAG